MSNRELSSAEFSALVIGGVALLAFCFISWQISSYMEVGFTTVASSLWLTLLWGVSGVAAYFWLPMFPRNWYLFLVICLVWPAWFPVVREAAANQALIPQLMGFELEQNDLPWWGRDFALYSSEVALFALIVVLVFFSRRNRY